MKIIAFILILTMFFLPLGFAEPHKRIIVPINNENIIADYISIGCEVIHEFDDALALRCPKSVKVHYEQEDTILSVIDSQANTQINALSVWKLGYTGKGITVAVLDTGIDKDHPELKSSIAGGKGFGYKDYEDDHGHGTHVSGIITADGINPNAKGVAPDAKIWMAKVCNSQGQCYSSDIAKAIDYVVKGPDGKNGTGDEPAKIISISLGGGGTSGANCDGDFLAQKVNSAVRKGVTVIVAAGNTPGVVTSPACASKAISVGAVTSQNTRASFSGYGQALKLVAPGVSIYSTLINGYGTLSGTSMAAPHVAGVAALMMNKKPSLTHKSLKNALFNTAVDFGTLGWDMFYGYGRVDALAAVNAV